MQKIINSTLALMLVFISINICLADSIYVTPTYTLRATNPDRTSATSYEFDIYLLHTNPNECTYQLAGQQYFIYFNPNIWNGHAVGDSLKFAIIESDLATQFRPRNPSISLDSTYLRLATNPAPGAGNGPIISSVSPGTKVCRVRLYSTGAAFTGDTINIRWRDISPLPVTLEFAYTGLDGNVNTNITTPDTHSIDSIPTGISPENVMTIIPKEFSLSQNYPNPFNPVTKIEFAIPVDGNVSLKIYDITGREVMNLVSELKVAGTYSAVFNASNFASGIYFYRLNAEGGNKKYESTKRMVLLK